MIIRSNQQSALQAQGWLAYQVRLCGYLRTRNLPTVAELAEPELLRRSGIAISRARRHNLDDECSVAAFAALMFSISPRFDEHSAAAAVLADRSLESNARMNAMTTRLSADDWRQAAEMPGDDIWESQAGT